MVPGGGAAGAASAGPTRHQIQLPTLVYSALCIQQLIYQYLLQQANSKLHVRRPNYGKPQLQGWI